MLAKCLILDWILWILEYVQMFLKYVKHVYGEITLSNCDLNATAKIEFEKRLA